MNNHAALLTRNIDQESDPVKNSIAKEKVAPSTTPRFSWEIDAWDTAVPPYITRFDTPPNPVADQE